MRTSPGHGDREPGTSLRWEILAFLVPFSCSLLLLGPVLGRPFFWDDHVYLLFARRLPFEWTFHHGLLGVYFRPLGGAALWLVLRAFGHHAVLAHLAGALPVAAAGGLSALLVRRWTADPLAAVLAGLLAVTALPVVTVGAWLSNVFSGLSILLGLAALLSARFPALSVSFGLLSVLAKEDGVLWLAGALVLIHADGGRWRRTFWSLGAAGAGGLGILAWRFAVLGGTGGVVSPGRLLAGLPGGTLGAGTLAALWLGLGLAAGPPLIRAACVVGLPSVALGLALYANVPRDPHGLWLRCFAPATFAAALLAGTLLARMRNRARKPAVGMAILALGIVGTASIRWEGAWRHVTSASGRLVRRTIGAIEAHPQLSGPVWIDGSGDEIALAAAIGHTRGDLFERVVPLRRRGVELLVCPRRHWPATRRVLELRQLPGNPDVVGNLVVAVGFPREDGALVPSLRLHTGQDPPEAAKDRPLAARLHPWETGASTDGRIP